MKKSRGWNYISSNSIFIKSFLHLELDGIQKYVCNFCIYYLQGTGIVHLTGYNIQDPGEEPLGFGDEDDYSSEDEAAEVEEIPALVNGKKRKAGASGDEATPATKKRNERKAAIEMAKKIANTIKVRFID